ncbi:unnamed protein product [Sphagnum balticum]
MSGAESILLNSQYVGLPGEIFGQHVDHSASGDRSREVSDLAKMSVQVVLPEFVAPTIITPKRTLKVLSGFGLARACGTRGCGSQFDVDGSDNGHPAAVGQWSDNESAHHSQILVPVEDLGIDLSGNYEGLGDVSIVDVLSNEGDECSAEFRLQSRIADETCEF